MYIVASFQNHIQSTEFCESFIWPCREHRKLHLFRQVSISSTAYLRCSLGFIKCLCTELFFERWNSHFQSLISWYWARGWVEILSHGCHWPLKPYIFLEVVGHYDDVTSTSCSLKSPVICEGNSLVTGEFPSQRASSAEKNFHLMTSSWTRRRQKPGISIHSIDFGFSIEPGLYAKQSNS